jgi:pimeloyl-ACP methyl ester carboxylesterase
MSAASSRGLSLRTIALASVAVLAGLAAFNRQSVLSAQRRYPPRGDFIRVRGVRLHMIDTGGSGPAVILLHGNGVTLADMEISGLVARAARRRRVVAFDRPGFGYSERPRGVAWTPAVQADLIAGALERMGIEQAVVVGHSWGSMVALALALDHPRLVQGLVLLSGHYFPTPRADAPFFIPPAIPVIGDVVRHTIAPLIGRLIKRSVLRKVFAPQPVPRHFSAQFPVDLSLRPGQIRASLEELALLAPSTAAVSRRYMDLSIPVTIMAGTADRLADPRRQSARLHETIRHSHLILLPGVGHMLHHVAPDEVVDAIEAVGKRPGLSPV